ncbi:tetratricopeptide repeat protein [Pseudoalteromonas sp. MMG012]|uniref:tetratricopeptide repeat protein n=1 Tax=Pseudoalteromonas sp. MMG012 TaxID=2822686 RepID=UPI001B3A759A|nr:tetratricopeptide repeat protein [Pseudoalteromonas sp. MMG012]MBQ4850025.1 sel1 repeat family protein [Pseudoalteromonas sp. MMG012]
MYSRLTQPLLQSLFAFHGFIERVISKHYRVLLVIILLAISAYSYISHIQNIALQHSLLTHPKIDDVYVINLGRIQTDRKYQAQYRVAQVLQVAENKIILTQSTTTYRRKRDAERAIKLDGLMLNSFFRSEHLILEREALLSMFAQDAIDDVYRPREIYVMGGIVKQRQSPQPINQKVHINNSVTTHNNEGIRLYRQNNFALAFNSFKIAAISGDAWAQYNLAGMFELGEGTSLDLKQAHYWYQKSAMQGHQRALHALEKLCKSTQSLCL